MKVLSLLALLAVSTQAVTLNNWLSGDDVDHSDEFFEASMDGVGPPNKRYERVIPEWFATGVDDIFMRSMIKQYALEGKNKDGTPNGRFFLDEALLRSASDEVLDNNVHMPEKDRPKYLETYFPRTWLHFDVNGAGKIGVESVPQFMRFLASDQTLKLQPEE